MKAQLLAAVTLLAVSFGLGAATDDQFVVHEWGTFTTAQGTDGEQIDWAPLYSVDLPEFVYSGAGNLGGFQDARQSFQGKDVIAPVRMETPVIYFYSQRERVADVSVLFRGGNVTEWYPQATNLKTQWTSPQPTVGTRQFLIEWNGVSILPRDTRESSAGALIRGKDSSRGNHYYVARETDANLLRVSSRYASKGIEHERHLFYRGVGWFKAPLTVGIDADEQQVSLTAREAEQIAAAFVVTVRNGMMRFQKIDAAVSNATSAIDINTQPFGALSDVRKLAMDEMARALVNAGLYEKEARAMANTWQDQWFEEQGTRVLYLLPRAWTDRTLQLRVAPQPDSVVRVMVGRAEIITPTMERKLQEQILTFSRGDAKSKARAVAGVRALGLGRFLNAAIWRVGAHQTDGALARATWELSETLNVDERGAREEARSARN